jgi:hypothetical protein
METTFAALPIKAHFTALYNGTSYTKIDGKRAQENGYNAGYMAPDTKVECAELDNNVSSTQTVASTVRMATTKQIAYITDLMARYGREFKKPENFTLEDASNFIDTILHEPTALNLFD